MKMEFVPHGVCSRKINIELEDGIIKEVSFIGGCNGNLSGISRLVKGKKAADVAALLKGVRCGYKPTSCPDQLAKALEEALDQEKA